MVTGEMKAYLEFQSELFLTDYLKTFLEYLLIILLALQ